MVVPTCPMPSSASARTSGSTAFFSVAAVVLVAFAAAFVWGGGLSAPFVLDDTSSISENASIRGLWPPDWLHPPGARGETVGGRPVLNLSLALNHALGGTDVRGYRLANVLIHALAALTLFGLVRRTMMLGKPHSAIIPAGGFALAVALLWFLHPLQTAAVTYVIQRAESLCGIFYLLTLYAFVRGADRGEAPHASDKSRPANDDRRSGLPPRLWLTLSVVSCALGMGTKEVMVSAPLLVLLCDRAFVAGSFAAAWRSRRGYYLALGATWLVLAALMLANARRGGSAGFGTDISAWTYALTQCNALLLYLKLAVWPAGQVFDYGTPTVATLGEVWWQAGVIGLLLASAVWALVKKPAIGTPAAAFFLILAPSSSFVPVATQTVAEHRLYLPLAVVILLVVAAVRRMLGTLPRRPVWISWTLAAAAILALGTAALARNRVYRSELTLWGDTVAKRPENPRARYNLGLALAGAGRVEEAEKEFRQTLALNPHHAFAHFELGKAALLAGRWGEAAEGFSAALTADSRFVNARVNLARALTRLDRAEEAIAHYRQALADEPGAADIHLDLAKLLIQRGSSREGETLLREALRLDDGAVEGWFALGNLLARQRRLPEATKAYEAVLARDPSRHDARANLANCQLVTGRIAEAITNYEVVLRARPEDERTRENLRLAREALAGR